MRARLQSLVALLFWACAVSAAAAADATLFRLFLKDGSAFVSYGEYSRVDDRVVFSMPVGGSADDPRLQVVWIPSRRRWTGRAPTATPQSARYQHYADTRGEEDFAILNNDVAKVLNDIALSTDRAERAGAGGQGQDRAGRVAEAAPRLPPGRRPRDRRAHRRGDRRAAGRGRRHHLRPRAGRGAPRRWPSSPCSACRRCASSSIRCCASPAMAPNATDRVALLQSGAGDAQRERRRPHGHRARGDARLARNAHSHRPGGRQALREAGAEVDEARVADEAARGADHRRRKRR